MFTLPDFKQKQILFIQNDIDTKTDLKFGNDNIILKKDGKITSRASTHKVLALYIIGDTTITTNLIQQCIKHGISIFFLKRNLEYVTSVEAQAEGNYLLRYQQYHLTAAKELDIAKVIVTNKIENQLALLKNTITKEDLKGLKNQTRQSIQKVEVSNELLGIEGTVSKYFFALYYKEMGWRRREPRVKGDIPNFLMDMGYTYLFNLIDSLLHLYGFDTYKGVYHKLFFQRKSLACDIIEPFRCIIDKAIIKAKNLGQIDEKDFDMKKDNITLDWKQNKKYSVIFNETIMENKEEIYKYIQQYYRYLLSPTKYDMPYFKVKIR
jgi:CRISP-associated protein Cas1